MTSPGPTEHARVAEALAASGKPVAKTVVQVRYEVVRLLSEQLYSSPLKAIEELVVNAWDADASVCRVSVPLPEEMRSHLADSFVSVFDNGEGMGLDGLADLWHVGRSRKREADWEATHRRKQIGKFGIGKLATYALGRQVTYVSRYEGTIHGVTLDFDRFSQASPADGTVSPIALSVLQVDDGGHLEHGPLADAIRAVGVDPAVLADGPFASWTLAVVERLTTKAQEIRPGRLHWVLQTAMPLAADFDLYLNDEQVESAKEEGVRWVVDFTVDELEATRLQALNEETGDNWRSSEGALVSDSFPSGVSGRVRVADQSLYYGKSGDLGRSHGFFVRVRNRLINEHAPLYGATPLSLTTFYNLHAVVDADDLDAYIKAPRDDVESGLARAHLVALLRQLFNQARELYEDALEQQARAEKQKKEGTRDYVTPRLIERPLADALLAEQAEGVGTTSWAYVEGPTADVAVSRLVHDLYEEPPRPRPYKYKTASYGRNGPLVRFNPSTSEFVLNEDHELVIEYWDYPHSRRLLQQLATAEAFLEVYLREFGVRSADIQLLLTRRDELLRSLARSSQYSLRAIALALRAARDDEKDLEVAVVVAVRALGFVTRQISGADQPDGTAHYEAFATGPSFTIEAKSSQTVPSLGAIDFAGLRSHAAAYKTAGCMLVAPDYPGETRRELSQASRRARQQRVSCWTIDQLARVVELSEARQINADQVQTIVLSAFSPGRVRREVDRLLSRPKWVQSRLYRAIIDALERLEDRMRNSPRDVSMLTTTITLDAEFEMLNTNDVRTAVVELAHASGGMLHVGEDDKVWVRGALEELRRRVADRTHDDGPPRRTSPFARQSD